MATDPTQRIANWDYKFDTTRIKEVLDAKRAKMLEHVSAVFPSLYAMETEVKQCIDGEGVSIIQYAYYLCFGREVWALQRKGVSGESLAIEVQTLIQKWVARGLSQTVLEKIRTDVFNTTAPTP